MIEKLIVEPIKSSQKSAIQSNATTRLPVNLALLLPIETYVFVGEKCSPEKAEGAEAKRSNEGTASRRERTCRSLVSSVGVQYFAPKCARFWMSIGKLNPTIKRTRVHYGIGIEDQNIFPSCLADAYVVPLRKTKIRTVL
jgi:hypothetical protein